MSNPALIAMPRPPVSSSTIKRRIRNQHHDQQRKYTPCVILAMILSSGMLLLFSTLTLINKEHSEVLVAELTRSLTTTSLSTQQQLSISDQRHLQDGTGDEVTVSVSREDNANSNGTPPPIPEGGERLVIEVNFVVSSTSTTVSDHSVDNAILYNTLQVFARTLMQEWAYRKRKLGNGEDISSSLRGRDQDNNMQQRLHSSRRRRLEVALVPETVFVSPHLVSSEDCITSVLFVVPEGETERCHKAHGRFSVDITADEDEEAVCRNMRTSVDSLMDENYLQEALALNYGESVTSTLSLQPGEMEACVVEALYVAPTSPAPITTVAPSVAPPGATVAPTVTPNVFDQSNNPDATTAPTLTPGPPTTAAPTAPAPTPAPVNEWLATLDQYTGDGAGSTDENNAEETTGSNTDDDDEQDTDSSDGSGSSTATNSSSNGGGGTRNYTLEMELLREEFYDDSTLDLVIFIMLSSFAGLLLLTCCCFCGDLAYHGFYAFDEEDAFYEDEDGNLYYDEGLQFPREQFTKGPNNELLPLIDEEDEPSSSDDEEDEGEVESGLFMSDSFSDSEENEAFAIDLTDGMPDESGMSGKFYVDDFDEDVEEEDQFDEDEEEEFEEFDPNEDDVSLQVLDEESADFFVDEQAPKRSKKKKK